MFNNINNKSWFNNKVLFIISLVIMSFSSFISVFAVSSYLYNSNEVSFNNSSSSSINSSNVQGAIDELYADAHNYEEMSGRVAALEGITHITNNKVEGLELNQSGILTAYGGYIDFHYNGSTADYTSRITEYSSGQLTLNATNGINLNGNPVKVNGNTIDGVYYVTGCSGTFSFANMTKCFKDKINSFPKNRPFLIQMNYSGQRYGMGYVYDGNAYANFTMVNFDGSTINIRNNNNSWAYKETNNTSNYTGVS